jgi:Spy/CpxP family protein refolding chaperone
MKQKLLAGLATVGLLASGGSAIALAAASAPAAASTAAAASSTPTPTATPMAPGQGHGPLSSLVAKGTITQAQAMAIRDAFITYGQTHWRSTVDTVLGQLVHNHTITQAQSRSVTNAITQWVQTHRGDPAGHRYPHHHRWGV